MTASNETILFVGTPKSHNPNHKFWIIQSEDGTETFVGRETFIKFGFVPDDLNNDVEVKGKAIKNEKGQKASFIYSVDGRISPVVKKAVDAKKAARPKKPQVRKVPQELTVGETYTGKVEKLFDEKGFGFIRVEGYESVFFHANDSEFSFALISDDARLTFTVFRGSKGLQARVLERVFEGSVTKAA